LVEPGNNAMKDSKLIPLLPLEEYQRRRRRRESDIPEIWDLLDAVKDPEIPVLSIWDLGVFGISVYYKI